jgi:hypothetical protein
MTLIKYSDSISEESSATTTTQTANISQKSNKLAYNRKINPVDLIAVPEARKGITFRGVSLPSSIRYYWRVLAQPSLALRVETHYVFRVAAHEEQLEQTEDAATTSLFSITALQNTEDESRTHRGVFFVTREPKVLFSKQIEISTRELPRWKPRVTIDRRMIEAEDD